MARKKPASIKPTTMRIPPDLLKRTDKVAKKQERSRTYKVIRWIEEGLARDEQPGGALD